MCIRDSGQAIDKLGSLLGGLEDSDSPDYLDTLLDILGGSPEDYGAYFSRWCRPCLLYTSRCV